MDLIPRFSPFEPAFASYLGEIPESFREQFLHSPDDPFHVVLDGHMDIWYRPQWLYPLFWALEKVGILVSETGNDIPIKLVVRAEYDRNNRPVHFWNRTFKFKTERYFNTILPYDYELGEVGDFIGKWKFVYIVWEARYHPPQKFTLDTKLCAFHFGNRFFWLPRWVWERLFGILHCDQVAHDLKGNTYDLDLVIRHPWLGDVFGYRGKFQTTRIPKESFKAGDG
jgi:hypothetical protein